MKVKIRVIQLKVSLMFRIGSRHSAPLAAPMYPPTHHSLEVTEKLSTVDRRMLASPSRIEFPRTIEIILREYFREVEGYRINAASRFRPPCVRFADGRYNFESYAFGALRASARVGNVFLVSAAPPTVGDKAPDFALSTV